MMFLTILWVAFRLTAGVCSASADAIAWVADGDLLEDDE